MAHDIHMAMRVREALAGEKVEEKSMFGSLGFMVNGSLCVSVKTDEMLYKLSPENFELAINLEGCRPMIQNGRVAKGWVFISFKLLQKQDDFQMWLNRALSFNKLNDDRKSL
jgi:TfoX/Sxy family transcriptional regulator of competence genes